MPDSMETLTHQGNGHQNVRIGGIGDLHYGRGSAAAVQSVLGAVGAACDVLVLAGDLTDRGGLDEAKGLAKELSAHVRVPIVAVLGNHDFESGCAPEITDVLRDAGVHVLDGDSCEVHGVAFSGVKGFCGGFGARALGSWGEGAIKQFVHEAVEEALKLEAALSRVTCPSKVAVLHYSPIAETLQGESPEIFPFLGSSRLEEPIGRFEVTTVFHGHAHNGRPEGHTSTGVPVYNVSWMVMQKLRAERPFRVVELPGRLG